MPRFMTAMPSVSTSDTANESWQGEHLSVPSVTFLERWQPMKRLGSQQSPPHRVMPTSLLRQAEPSLETAAAFPPVTG